MLPYVLNSSKQNFPFQNCLINYLIDKVNGKLLKKLHKTCKFFYIRQPFNLLDILAYYNLYDAPVLSIYYDKNVPLQDNHDKLWSFIEKKNIWVLYDLNISLDTPNILSKIVRCDVQRLSIFIKLSFDELKFLTDSGKVEEFFIKNKIYFSDDRLVAPEEILQLMPKAFTIAMFGFNFSEKTMQKLVEINHAAKIVRLLWHEIEEWINVDLINQFLQKFLGSNRPHMSIVYNNADMKELFKLEMCERIEKWENTGQKPRNFPYIHINRVPDGFVFP